MTTPNSDTGLAGGSGSDTNPGSRTDSLGADDVSIGRSGGSGSDRHGEGAAESAGDTMQRGLSGAQNALEQLQQKASEMTSQIIGNIDVDDLTQKLEQQVREHPARTLLVALGAGFVLGRAAKR